MSSTRQSAGLWRRATCRPRMRLRAPATRATPGGLPLFRSGGWPMHSASPSIIIAAEPSRRRTPPATGSISTASSQWSPNARTTLARKWRGTRARSSRSTQPAPCAASRGRNATAGAAASQFAGPLTSTTAATSAPALTTPAATAASSGPAPATTTRLPGEMRWDFSIVVAAARPNTPGVVHPGNGSKRSIAPVASAGASTACAPPSLIASSRKRVRCASPTRRASRMPSGPRSRSARAARHRRRAGPGPCLRRRAPPAGESRAACGRSGRRRRALRR